MVNESINWKDGKFDDLDVDICWIRGTCRGNGGSMSILVRCYRARTGPIVRKKYQQEALIKNDNLSLN